MKDADVDFEPLVQTGVTAGTISYAKWQANQDNPLSLQEAEGPPRGKYVLAARVKGKSKDGATADGKDAKDGAKDGEKEGEAKSGEWKDKPINVIYVGDIDLMASAFVRIRAQPDQMFRWRFENVTFALNVIDALSGDDAYLDIRKRKTKYSTLTVIEKQSEEARTKEQEERTKFEEEYSNAIKKAEGESKELVKKFEDARNAIDDRKQKGEQVDPKEEEAIAIQLVVQSQISQQRLDTERDRLKRDRDARIKEAGRRLDQQIDGIQDSFKVWAVTLPLFPPLLVGLSVFVRRRLREREGISKARLI